MKLHGLTSSAQRREYLKKKLGIDIHYVAEALIDKEEGIHCENLIGAISLPLGVAGPLKINGNSIRGDFFIPLATTEGALVASVNRGCKAINISGGVITNMYRIGATRGPVFYTGSLKVSQKLYQWVKENKEKLTKVSEKTSSHLKLLKIDVRSLSNYVFLRCYFDTQEAMGMNMVTIATEKIVEAIKKETGIKCIALAGNFDIDKKPAWLNFINNRGFKVWAEVVITEKVVRDTLKTTPEQFFEVWLAKCMLGSAMSGSLGFNAHFANIIAAFFAATGQDIAHTVEGSMGITTAKVLEKHALYISVYLPAVMLGTVGGGTKLATQKEAQEILGVKKSEELVQVLAGAVLAGELSLIASLAEGSLANTHQKLGR